MNISHISASVCNDQCPRLTGVRTGAAAQPWTLGTVLSMSNKGHSTDGTIPLGTKTLFTYSLCSVETPTLPSSTGSFPCVLSSWSQMYHNSASHRPPAANASPPGVSECCCYKPSDKQHIQRYQQRVMKGMSRQSAAESQDKNHPGVYSRVGNTTLK